MWSIPLHHFYIVFSAMMRWMDRYVCFLCLLQRFAHETLALKLKYLAHSAVIKFNF